MDNKTYSPKALANLAKWLKVISEPNRLLLLEQIIEGVQCNCELGETLQMAPNLISHHLGILRESGLVTVERDPNDARWVYYSINIDAMEEMKSLIGSFFDLTRFRPRRTDIGPQQLTN